MHSNVVAFDAYASTPEDKKPSLRDVPKTLRTIADNIEAGEYGDVLRGALVLRAVDREPQVFGFGDLPVAAQAYMDFHAGADQIMAQKSPTR